MMNKQRAWIIWGLVMLSMLAACSADTPTEIPPEEIVMNSVTRMREVQGFQFIVLRSGESAFLDEAKTLSFRRAEGSYLQPDHVSATIRVVAPGLVADIDLISMGDRQWQTNLLTRAWESVPPENSFNPADLFDPESGIPAALELDLSGLELIESVEIDELPGQVFYTLRGQLDGGRAFEMSFGLIGPGTLDISLWIAPETFELYRMIVVEPGMDGEDDTTWQIDFWDFDQVGEIEEPILE